MDDDILPWAAGQAARYLESLPERPVHATASIDDLRATLGGDLPADGEDPRAALERLVAAADPGLVATAGPRYFGFVIGGTLPADDRQPLAGGGLGPERLRVRDVARRRGRRGGRRRLAPGRCSGCPPTSSVGFVTGRRRWPTSPCLAAARHAVLARAGWDVEARGLYGAPGGRGHRRRRRPT